MSPIFRSFSFLASIFISASMPAAVFANGGIGSGGGDLKSAEENSAWFTGNRTVVFCSHVAPDFGYSEGRLSELIIKSVETWKDYSLTKLTLAKRPIEFRTPFEYFAADKTQNNPNPDCDLTFYFGEENPEVREAMRQYLNPLSFAQRTSYDVSTGWGKGFIWFRNPRNTDLNKFPDLKNQSVLEVMLTHEIGHVLGNSHRDGTIMSDGIVNLLKRVGDQVGALDIDEIDQQRELVTCEACDLKYRLLPWGDNSEITKKLLGRNPQGRVNFWADVGSMGSVTLILKDDVGQVKFPVRFLDAYESSFADQNRSFKVVRIDSWNNQPFVYAEHAIGQIQYGTIDTSEKPLGILIERNSNAGPLSISITHDDRISRLASGALCSDSSRSTNRRCNL